MEVNGVDFPADGFKTDALSDESFSDKARASSPADLPITPNPANLVTGRVVPFWQTAGKRRRAFPVPLRGCFLSQSLVRTKLVVTSQPEGGPMLLAPPRLGRRPGGFPLQDAMKLFVRSIILRSSWPGE